MSFAPLFAAGPVVTVHAFAALAALVLGASQLLLAKGTPRHRAIGWLWAGLMLALALSSFWIHDIRLWGAFSPIHLLSIFALVMVPVGLLHARAHRVRKHRITMQSLFWLALVGAGVFTLLPGRVMHAVVLGQ